MPQITYCHTLDSLGYIFVADSTDLTSTTVTLLAPKATKLEKMKRNNGYYATQAH